MILEYLQINVNRPTDVQITSDGKKMVVTDRNNSRVLVFNKIPHY